MRRHSLLKYLGFWTEGARHSSSARSPRPTSPARPAVSFTPEQLDQLYEDLATAGDDSVSDRTSP